MLSLAKLKEIIESPDCERIAAAREMNKKLALHVDGVGLQGFLSRINNYENENQFNARAKHAISNKFITEELLRPTDNAFNARGGSKNYRFKSGSEEKEKSLIERLSKIRNSHSLSWYVENEWFNKFITDPNGLIVIESDGKDVAQSERNAYPTYKSIHSIKAYEQNGIYVDWVVFESHKSIESIIERKFSKNKAEKIDYYWAVDEVNWYLIARNGENVSIDETLPHGFDKVPAILCSSIVDNVTGWKKSPIDAQVGLLDKYVVDNSILNISEFFHNYPREFAYVDDCIRCNGTGNIGTADKWVSCPNCSNGMPDRKDVTDLIKMRVPKEGDAKIGTPGGYIYMPTDASKLMVESVDRTWNRIFFSHWGTVVSREGKNETATGRYIDAQPVNNRLNKYSKSIEQAHAALANFLGKYYYKFTFEDAFVQYGRRYLIETPDQIWEKYLEAKTQKAPVSTLDILLSQYLESEFRENEQMYIVETKKVKLEPFVHWDIELVRRSETIPNDDKQKKEFYGEWVQMQTVEYLYNTELSKLRSSLDKYAKTKKINTDGIVGENNN